MIRYIESMIEKNIIHTSNEPVKIIRVNTISKRCNIAPESYIDEENYIHFSRQSYQVRLHLVEAPTNVVYLQVNLQWVDNITLSVVDEDDDDRFSRKGLTAHVYLNRMS